MKNLNQEKAITSIQSIDRQTVRMGAPFQKRIRTAAVAAGDCYRDRLDDYHISRLSFVLSLSIARRALAADSDC